MGFRKISRDVNGLRSLSVETCSEISVNIQRCLFRGDSCISKHSVELGDSAFQGVSRHFKVVDVFLNLSTIYQPVHMYVELFENYN